MSTWHEQALNTHVEELLIKDPQWAEILTHILRRMRAGSFPNLDDVVQYPATGRKPYTYVDAYVMANIHAALAEHKIAQFTIEMRCTAPRDRDLESLSDALKGKMTPFVLEMWGKYGDEDGIVSWDRPVRAYLPGYEPTEVSGQDQQCQEPRQILLPPAQTPLEVGSTHASRSWMHLLQDGGLARWPYESKEIHVYVVIAALIDNEMHVGRNYPTVQLLTSTDTDPYVDANDEMRWVP